MDGILGWLLGQAKDAGAIGLVAIAALAAVAALWRMHIQDRKTILDQHRAMMAISREGTRALLGNARAITKLTSKLERNGRGR